MLGLVEADTEDPRSRLKRASLTKASVAKQDHTNSPVYLIIRFIIGDLQAHCLNMEA